MNLIALLFFFAAVAFTMKTFTVVINMKDVVDGRSVAQAGMWMTTIAWTATAFFANWFNLY